MRYVFFFFFFFSSRRRHTRSLCDWSSDVCSSDLEMCGQSKELPSYSGMNTEVYGISGDNPFAQEAWAQKEKIGVKLLSDYEHKVAKDYGVVYDSFLPQLNLGMAGVPKRSAFIVDKDGVIQYAESNDDAKQLPNFDKIKAKLAELK